MEWKPMNLRKCKSLGGHRTKDGMCIKTIKGWTRVYDEESGVVHRWYEKGYIVASLVDSDRLTWGHQPLQELRVVNHKNAKWFTIPASESIISKCSDEEIIRTVEMHLRRKGDIR